MEAKHSLRKRVVGSKPTRRANLRSSILSTIDNLRELVSIQKAAGIDNIVVDICTEAIRDINRLSIENKALKEQVSDLRAAIDCANRS